MRLAGSAKLPDCRGYEQVSPAEKDGTNAFSPIFPLPAEASATEGNTEGDSIAYQNLGEFGSLAADLIGNAYLATRTASGWQSSNLTPPTPGPVPTSAQAPLLGYDFSPDLSRIVIPVIWQALTPETPAFLDNLFLRGQSGSYTLLTTALPKVPVPEGCALCYGQRDIPAFAGASSDYTHVIFEASESLTPSAPGEGVQNLYESYEALSGKPREVRLVGILPDGEVPVEGSMPGAGIGDTRINHYSGGSARAASSDIKHAVSEDGSHVVFSALADGGLPDPSQVGLTELYDREDASQTVEISVPAEGAAPANSTPESAQFWASSADGSLVYFSSSAELTTQSNTGSGNASQDLYRYDVNTKTLTDLTVDPNPLDASSGAGVQGVVGASEDGSYVYFVATGQLAGGAVDGEPNLYVSHEGGAPLFVAALNNEDFNDWTSTPAESSAYITPDGSHLAFMSINSPTGYDNEDQNSSQPDSEVYEYSAVGGSLTCASCDPSGARPIGNAFIGAADASFQRIGTPFYQPRTLNNDGSRLFFSSPDPLTNEAGAGNVRVFEYEDGVVYSISGSASSASDIFLDASPSGNDVFFATYDQLVGSDQDNLMDIYDARVGGGFPPASAPAGPCIASACQGAPAVPPVFGPPSSTALSGAGNLVQTSPGSAATRRKKTSAQVKAEKLVKSLKVCRKLKSHKKRLNCEAQARKRYGSKGKSKSGGSLRGAR